IFSTGSALESVPYRTRWIRLQAFFYQPPLPSRTGRQFKPLPVFPPEQFVGLVIVQDALVLRVPAQGAADAVGDVAEVAKQRALVAVLDVGVGALAALDAIEEIPQVGPLRVDPLVGSLGPVDHAPALFAENQRPLFPIEDDAERRAVQAGF